MASRTLLSDPLPFAALIAIPLSPVMADLSPRVWVAHKVRHMVCSVKEPGFMLAIVRGEGLKGEGEDKKEGTK